MAPVRPKTFTHSRARTSYAKWPPCCVPPSHSNSRKLTFPPINCYTSHPVLYWGKPEQGDIIVFRYPEDEDKDFIKRMRTETERVHRTLRDLLQFARPARELSPAARPPGDVEGD